MGDNPKGDLIIIGGHEDKQGDRAILTEVARRAKRGRARELRDGDLVLGLDQLGQAVGQHV